MPDLHHCLKNHDLGFLQIVADLWGLDLEAPDARSALPHLQSALADPTLAREIIESLPKSARKALDALIANQGWMPWSRFIQRFGALREVGPGKRDREKPYLDPISASEVLWYRGLIGRDFLRRGGSLQECAYIPEELLALMPPIAATGPRTPGRAASPKESAQSRPATDRVLDHTCTLLAALRLGEPKRSPALTAWTPPYNVVHALLAGLKLITTSEQPVPEDARPFLEMPRGEALAWLVQGWLASDLFNELRLVPGLICEGAWHNDPKATREKLLAHLSAVPEGKWWNLDSFIQALREQEPDFQRPAGDFDTWLIRDARTGESLQGLTHWEAVDGALIRYLITGPLHWFGLVDLAGPKSAGPAAAFRFSSWSSNLLLGKPVAAPEEKDPVRALSNASLIASVHTPRLARYQISRFGLWVDETAETYTYRLSPTSLEAAAAQGLRISHLETLLDKYGEKPPPGLIQTLRDWAQHGETARIHPCVVLRVRTPKILQILRNSPASRFLGDPLGPTTAIINPGAAQKLADALARLGYLCDVELSGGEPAAKTETDSTP